MDKILSAIQHAWVVIVTTIITTISVVIPGYKNLPPPSSTPTPLVEQVVTPSASPTNKQSFVQTPKKVLGTNTEQDQSKNINQNQPTHTTQQTPSITPTPVLTQTSTMPATSTPTPMPAYKPCCTSPSGEQISLETVDCLSYNFGKSHDFGQAVQKIKDATGLKLDGSDPNEINGSVSGNVVEVFITLYKNEAYDYSGFHPDYPGGKKVLHYVPASCTDDLKQKIISALDAYKATLP